jgi:protein O-mannosyl-transferase
VALFAVGLFLTTITLYYPALGNDFVNYDDPDYVTSNTHVEQGLTATSIAWAFRSIDEANWHPLTWLSHMLDVTLFGLRPAGHHAESIFWHAANVVLLFVLLAKATSRVGRSALVAALFAVHPLNVESVAWVAERKTVLSAFFLLLAIAAYGWYRKKPRVSAYLIVAICFALGLMAKPMVITFPFLLLLLDFWPLGRFPATPLAKLVAEKIPLLVLSTASAVITLYAQRSGGALGTVALLPFPVRLKNAIYSYLIYVEKTFWPSGLAVFYPHPEASLALWKVLIAATVLVAISGLVWYFRAHRYLSAGWLWFLGTLIPVIGIVQVGRQAWADRYAYIPLWGLFVIIVWLLAEAAARVGMSYIAQIAIALALLFGYFSDARAQIRCWQNSFTLFTQAIETTGDNGLAEGNLGSAFQEINRSDLARPHLERAVQLSPTLAAPHYNLGILLHRENDLEGAERQYRLALKYASDNLEAARAHNNLGALYNQVGKYDQAAAEYNEALGLNPNEENSIIGLGIIKQENDDLNGALQEFLRAEKIAPSPVAFYWQGIVLERMGQTKPAVGAYENALRLAPQFDDAKVRLENLRRMEK